MTETVARDMMQVTVLVDLQSEFAGRRRPSSTPTFRLGNAFSADGSLPNCELLTELLVGEYHEQGYRPTKMTGLAVFTDGSSCAFKMEDAGPSGYEQWGFDWIDQHG
jgi:hypothetical protein